MCPTTAPAAAPVKHPACAPVAAPRLRQRAGTIQSFLMALLSSNETFPCSTARSADCSIAAAQAAFGGPITRVSLEGAELRGPELGNIIQPRAVSLPPALRAGRELHHVGRRPRQRLERHVVFLAAQPQTPERALGDAKGQFEPVDQVCGSEHAIAGLSAHFLDTSGGVDGVAEEDDFLLHRAHLAGDHGTAMQPGAEIRGGAEFADIFWRETRQTLHRGEAGRYAMGVRNALRELPGRDQLIADIAVDFAAP